MMIETSEYNQCIILTQIEKNHKWRTTWTDNQATSEISIAIPNFLYAECIPNTPILILQKKKNSTKEKIVKIFIKFIIHDEAVLRGAVAGQLRTKSAMCSLIV